jgi:hypothetical protein
MGWLAVGAGVLFGAALASLTAFFVTKEERFDRVAEWSFVLFALCAIPTMLTVAGLFPNAGILIPIATATGIVSVTVMALAELGATLKLVDFGRIAPIVTVAFVGFLVWIGLISVLILTQGGSLPAALGWLGVVSIVLGVAIVAFIARQPGVIAGEREPERGPMIAFVIPMAGIVGWLVLLGLSL